VSQRSVSIGIPIEDDRNKLGRGRGLAAYMVKLKRTGKVPWDSGEEAICPDTGGEI